ncbi:excalibur calcium-binding domain-containing protein [Cognatilysobacter terrigena]|uniref:excalibur calcium-binding domain-containing protein n=1 Tax=Cognatilysobacter terrigena TaxID=2488749 RepID=UPI00105FF836|nr:excalibur calcium-binding domain-containing protein [Lysobacter terrigena]
MTIPRVALMGMAGALLAGSVMAHPGGLDANGCHHDRKHGGYHCHGARASRSDDLAPARLAPSRAERGSVYYPNCRTARAAGAAPVRRGDPGYASHLDRDGDGIGCE